MPENNGQEGAKTSLKKDVSAKRTNSFRGNRSPRTKVTNRSPKSSNQEQSLPGAQPQRKPHAHKAPQGQTHAGSATAKRGPMTQTMGKVKSTRPRSKVVSANGVSRHVKSSLPGAARREEAARRERNRALSRTQDNAQTALPLTEANAEQKARRNFDKEGGYQSRKPQQASQRHEEKTAAVNTKQENERGQKVQAAKADRQKRTPAVFSVLNVSLPKLFFGFLWGGTLLWVIVFIVTGLIFSEVLKTNNYDLAGSVMLVILFLMYLWGFVFLVLSVRQTVLYKGPRKWKIAYSAGLIAYFLLLVLILLVFVHSMMVI